MFQGLGIARQIVMVMALLAESLLIIACSQSSNTSGRSEDWLGVAGVLDLECLKKEIEAPDFFELRSGSISNAVERLGPYWILNLDSADVARMTEKGSGQRHSGIPFLVRCVALTKPDAPFSDYVKVRLQGDCLWIDVSIEKGDPLSKHPLIVYLPTVPKCEVISLITYDPQKSSVTKGYMVERQQTFREVVEKGRKK